MNKKQKVEKVKNREIKQGRKLAVKKVRNKYIHWECTVCHKISNILINLRNEGLYTEARRKTYVCINCK